MEKEKTEEKIKISLTQLIMWILFILFIFVAFIYYAVPNEKIVEYRGKVNNTISIINYNND